MLKSVIIELCSVIRPTLLEMHNKDS